MSLGDTVIAVPDTAWENATAWFGKMVTDLNDKADDYENLDTYYRGLNAVPVATSKATRQSYARLMRIARTNFAELIVEAVRDRMQPQAFRTGAVNDDVGDQDAWRVWQGNSLDADLSMLLIPQLALGSAFAIVGPVDPEIGVPVITPEDPREVTCVFDPMRRRKVAAALKLFRDDFAGADRAFVYLPGIVFRYVRPSDGDVVRRSIDGFRPESVSELPIEVGVPVVPFLNRPDRAHRTTSEIEPHLALLDRIAYTVLQRLEIATLQAFRQRAVKGTLPNVDENGNEIDYDDVFASDPGALWQLPDGVDLWESQPIDLTPIRSAVRDDVTDLAAVTRTPLYYLTPEAATGSAEGASLAREGLVFKVEDRMKHTSESLEVMMAKAFAFMGDPVRANRVDMETVWYPAERMTWGMKADAMLKALDCRIPWRTAALEIGQFSAQEVARMEADQEAEALSNAQLDAMTAAAMAPPEAGGPLG
jgi:hypothetical protein